MELPTWAVALVLAFAAPFCARALGNYFERDARARTKQALGDTARRNGDPPRSTH